MLQYLKIACILIQAAGIYGCRDKQVEINGFSISPKVVNLIYGGTPDRQQLTITTDPPDASVTVYYSSNDKLVATVSETGLIVATGIGTAQITVMINNKISFVDVSVALASEGKVSKADTWAATDALGRKIATWETCGNVKKRYVGIFYFLWLGAHGYDVHEDHQTVQIPKSTDTKSPYDISKLLAANPANPQYGPVNAFHHWAEPHFGYYVSNDEWVIEKHIQLLTDAGVDVLIFDNTNAVIYQENIETVCRVMERMKAQGRATLKIASIFNSNSAGTLQQLYDNFYARGKYRDFWFEWQGKPLALCSTADVSSECSNFFTLRHSWFDTRQGWFGNGKDKWAWGDYYPQNYGWHDNAGKAEQISVAAATHPTSNIGRSYSNGNQPAVLKSDEGLFFSEQWNRALTVDPEFIFITGWNEWVAMRFTNGAVGQMCGKPIRPGDTYFVDQYNEEYSRDIEPMRGGFGDNYYYQMVDMIRRFKGVNPTPFAEEKHTVTIDGNAQDWGAVGLSYYDDTGDVASRNHFGWGGVGTLTNTFGRNDFVLAQAANDDSHAFFLAKTDQPVVLSAESPVQLFIGTGQEGVSWEGFRFLVNILPGDKAGLHVCKGGWSWEKVTDVPCRIADRCIELSIPLQQLGLSDKPVFDFKWADNMPQTGDIRDFMDHGDTAPNARFRYRYVFQ
ncbi:MAG: Ig-like domain-containing protein [Bacteroidales bacterium]|nr:Ig-like domain-containing protein [Bacteroidales bacterium]